MQAAISLKLKPSEVQCLVLTNCGIEDRNDGGGKTKTSVCILSKGGIAALAGGH